MPLFKGSASKSTPDKAISYITNPKKATHISVRNLYEDEDYAEQFRETANRFGKGNKYGERKYYHFKLSCAQKDKVDTEEAHVYASELATRLFKDCECVIATHNDTKTIHSHIIVNAVNPITGKKLRFNNNQYAAMKDEANVLGKEFGYTPINFRKPSVNKRTPEENHIKLKGGTSWKEDLREVIEEAKLKSTTEEEFVKHLLLYNVKITRSKTEYSFLHPEKEKPIRGKRLGENYNKEFINNVITKNRYRRDVETVAGTTRKQYDSESGLRHRTYERSVSDIQQEQRRINRAAECAFKGADFNNEGNSVRHSEDGLQHTSDSKQVNPANGGGIPENKPNKVGNQANRKKRDYDYSK